MMRWILTGCLLGAMASSFEACSPSARCNSSTCPGCCDSMNKCQLGNQNSACGAKGAACTSCGLGQVCSFGGTCSGNTGAGTAAGGGFVTAGGNTSGGVSGGGFAGGGSAGGGFAGGGSAGGGFAGGGAVTGGGAATGGGGAACSPLTCLGCCLNGACQNGNNPAACGRAGNTCTVCNSGDLCNVTGACQSQGAGGGAPACNTCYAQTGGQTVCVPQGTNLQLVTCGINGNVCTNCASRGFTACTGGVCTGSPVGGGTAGGAAGGGGTGGGAPASGVGSICTSASQCQASLGPTAICKTQTNPHSGFFPSNFAQGFCTLPCTANGQANCGPGNVCAGGVSSTLALYNERDRYCVNACTAAGTCQAGMECYAVEDGTATAQVGGCWVDLDLPNAPPFSGGGIPTNLGGTCTDNAGCANPPDPAVGACFGGTELPAAGYPGGYCIAFTNFAPDSYCTQANGIEFLLRSGADGGVQFWCGQACAQLGSTPRTGYRCTPVFLPDAGIKGGAVFPQRCATSADCSTVTGAMQCNTQFGQCCVTSTSALTRGNCTGLTGL